MDFIKAKFNFNIKIMTEPIQDLYECKVYCINCNAYLYSVSIFEPISQGQNTVGINCPHPEKCEDERNEANLRRFPWIFPFYH